MVRNHQGYGVAVCAELDGRLAKIEINGMKLTLGMKQGNNE
jgi:hypothetical protein